MNDKTPRVPLAPSVIHLPKAHGSQSAEETQFRELDLKIAEHFRKQNEILHANNREQGERIQRLTTGIEKLVTEMHGVRTGQKEEAFARVGAVGVDPDLPTVSAEAALFYTSTAKQIGSELGFHSSQIGILLGPKGLKWAGNGDYQEVGRASGPGDRKFWHREVAAKLIAILDENRPDKYGIVDKAVLAVFRKWQQRRAAEVMLSELDLSDKPH